MQKGELHPLVLQLQDAGVLISRKSHNSHHREPFENNYCIVSGMCNERLDSSGVLQWMEHRIYLYLVYVCTLLPGTPSISDRLNRSARQDCCQKSS